MNWKFWKNAVTGSGSASKADVVKAIGGSSPSSSARPKRIVQISKNDLLVEMGKRGINIASVTIDGVVLAREAEMLIVDGIIVKNRHGPAGKNVRGTIIVDEERDEEVCWVAQLVVDTINNTC